ncbi:T9SS type A sorting domain-containing protein, partial [Maribellus sediminis]|uniref:T9SS type A sorting domain-containing protein n=1 Tax=Maribellus sediminis TaxID=2696285 RepID=UPI0014315DE8
DACGGSVDVMWIVSSDCADTIRATRTFTVTDAPAIEATPPADLTLGSCLTQDSVNTAYDAWVASGVVTGGCGLVVDIVKPDAPDACGGSVDVMWIVSSDCADTIRATRTFTVTDAPLIDVSCPAPVNMSCASLEAIQEAYETWVAGFVIHESGCSGIDTITDIPELPEDVTCAGADLSYTLHVEDNCSSDECTSTFVVTPCKESCETAFAKLPMIGEEENPNTECFIDHGFNRWGWTNSFEPVDSTYTLPLYAGAAQCDVDKGMLVGMVEITYSGGTLTVHYVMDDPHYLSEVHVNVGCEMFPSMKNGKETVAPGQFTYGESGLDKVTEYTVEFSEIYGNFWVIAHGVSCYVEYCSPVANPGDGEYVFDGGTLECGPKSATIGSTVTDVISIEQNELKVYPNPFDEVVNIEFVSSVSGHAVLEIHNMVGQRVATLMDQFIEAGVENKVQFRPDSEVSGFYLYKLNIDGDIQIGKMIYRHE